jgi:hypothetical protein
LCYFFAKKNEKGAIMKKNDSQHPLLSQVLMVLQNINDNLRRIDDRLINLENKFNSSTQKHLIVIKKGKGDDKNAKA